MLQTVRDFWMLMWPKLLGLRRMFRTGATRHELRAVALGIVGLVFAYGIFAGSAWFLRQVLAVELVGELIPQKLMSLVLLILLSVLLISTTISSFSIFFLSDDLLLLVSSPVPVGSLYFARFVEMVVHSSWMVLFFGLPVLMAFGSAYSASWDYYLAVALLFPALVFIPAALGSAIATILTRLLSARRSRDLLVVLVVLAFIAIYLLIRTMRPEKLLDGDSFGTMMQFLNMFQTPESNLLPSQWMTSFLMPILEGKGLVDFIPALAVWSTSAALISLNCWLGAWLYLPAFDRAQTGRVKHKPGRKGSRRILGTWLDELGKHSRGITGPLLVKDLKVFLRDTNQWLQLLLLGALAAVYVLNFTYLKLAEFSWFTLYIINHAMVGLVLAGVAVRFVFPAVSLEGRAWWIVRSAPISLDELLHSKLIIHFIPLAILGVVLSILSCVVIDVPLAFGAMSVGLVLAAALCVSAMGVGLGAVFPKFTAENPAKIPTGVGGVVFMISSMSFVLVFLLTSIYPAFTLYRWPFWKGQPMAHPIWFYSSLGAMVILVLVGTWLPMWLGKKYLSARED